MRLGTPRRTRSLDAGRQIIQEGSTKAVKAFKGVTRRFLISGCQARVSCNEALRQFRVCLDDPFFKASRQTYCTECTRAFTELCVSTSQVCLELCVTIASTIAETVNGQTVSGFCEQEAGYAVLSTPDFVVIMFITINTVLVL